MTLFTGKGDEGTTSKFNCNQRFSKSAKTTEALGTVDELNSFLGLIKTEIINIDNLGEEKNIYIRELENIQENLFIVQAEIAGAPKKIEIEKVDKMSELINQIEKEMPPITTFLIAGGSKISAMFDFARTICRRAERRLVSVSEEEKTEISKSTLAYLNRLSSMLYARARLLNHKFGINEEGPSYK